ncbi:IS256 family transposase, partial [Candidatus Riflebacteria bacterium]
LKKFRERTLGCYPYLILDARYEKVRHLGTVRDLTVLIAIGVNDKGYREIMGVSVSLSEAEVHWRDFLKSFQKRGLTGVQLIVSDDHTGLKKAKRATFPSVPWQRCQFHMIQNSIHYAPKKAMREEIVLAMRSIFNAMDLEMAIAIKEHVIKKYARKAPEFVSWLENNIEEGLTVFAFPAEHRKRLRTTNALERLNREIKRRTRVASLFPNSDSRLRLVTAILQEKHEEWITGRRYLRMEFLKLNSEPRKIYRRKVA